MYKFNFSKIISANFTTGNRLNLVKNQLAHHIIISISIIFEIMSITLNSEVYARATHDLKQKHVNKHIYISSPSCRVHNFIPITLTS